MKRKFQNAAKILIPLAMAALGGYTAFAFSGGLERGALIPSVLFCLSCTEVLFSLLSTLFLWKKKKGGLALGVYTVTFLLWIPVLFFGGLVLAFTTGLLELPAQN